MSKMTKRQGAAFMAVHKATAMNTTEWYRAKNEGERIALEALFYKRLVSRRAWRGVEGHLDAAHEYRLGRTLDPVEIPQVSV